MNVSEEVKALVIKSLRLPVDSPSQIADSEPMLKGSRFKIDSIDYLEIVADIEKEFNVKVSDDDLKSPEIIFKDFGTLAKYVEQKVNAK